MHIRGKDLLNFNNTPSGMPQMPKDPRQHGRAKRKPSSTSADASDDQNKSSKRVKKRTRVAGKQKSRSPWAKKYEAVARLRACATSSSELLAAEKALTKLVAVIPEDDPVWEKVSGKLATLLIQSGRNLRLAATLLTERGFRYRLSTATLTQDHSR